MNRFLSLAIIVIFFSASGLFVYFVNQKLYPADSSAAINLINPCTTVEYGEWGECVNGERFREVITMLPFGCNILKRPVETQPCSQDNTIKYCLDSAYCGENQNCNRDLCLSPCNGAKNGEICLDVCYGKCEPNIGTFPEITLPPSQTLENSCGRLDSNNDNLVNIIDFDSFTKKYGQSCVAGTITTTTNGCGFTDFNNDESVNIIDFDNFVKKFGKESCF